MEQDCIRCDLNQINKIVEVLNLDDNLHQQMLQTTKDYLAHCDKTKTNPEIMGEIWKRIIPLLQTDDPYEGIKSSYNQLFLTMEADIMNQIFQSNDPLKKALKLSIIGNLIDFAAKHKFDTDTLLDLINKVDELQLSLDYSDDLLKKLESANTLLYLGDNCGEIVIDKCFIQVIKKYFPNITVYYGVRGNPIVNDVTMQDALDIKMDEAATIISNGDGSLGTVLSRTSKEFQSCFSSSDIIIAKGQGNYEGLLLEKRNNIFFLFMAKCDVIATSAKVSRMDIVCLKK